MWEIMGIGAGVALTLVALAQSGQSRSSAPSAPAIPDDTINKAGAALHDVAHVNQEYAGEMEKASPAQKQTLSAQANAEAVQAIQSHGLSVEQYTIVIRTAQKDQQLKQCLLSAADRVSSGTQRGDCGVSLLNMIPYLEPGSRSDTPCDG